MYLCTFTFSGKIFLLLQNFVANAQISCFGKIILQMQDFLANVTFSPPSSLIETAMHSRKKTLHLQEKSCICKIILPKQEICAFATKSCNIFPLNVKVLCVCSGSPIFVAIQYIKFEILKGEVADFHLHQISFHMSGKVQKWHWHLQNIFITFKS